MNMFFIILASKIEKTTSLDKSTEREVLIVWFEC